ncbi:tetratricopeptide repeat protein, partial [Actinophytocola sp.]|uniref:tetratricopeptide repeat protein n=1 Tax=Actinophytocola sp. TaxID=1872138 RepID=UPI00389B22D3
MTGPAPATVEPVWENLRSQLALQPGFWLGFLFCGDLYVLDELQARARNYSRIHLKNTQAIRVEQPDDLMSAMPWLLGDHTPDLALTWLIGVTGDAEPWRDAWARFLRRLNERRDLLRKVLPAGVILACPPSLLVTARESAPDLWSYRAMVAVVDATSTPVERTARPTTPPGAGVDDGDLRWAVEHVLDRGVTAGPELLPILRRVGVAVQANHPADAVAAARQAFDAAGTPSDRALAHAWLAVALRSRDDLPAALRHARQALAARQPLGRELTARLVDLVAETPDLDEQLAVRKARVDIDRLAVERVGGGSETLRDLSRSLDKLGAAYETRGQLDQADEAYLMALDIDRGAINTQGETPEALGDLSISLNRVGDIHLQRGQLDQALTHYNESLELGRRIHNHYDQTPQTLRDLSISLESVGDIHRQRGQLDQALTHYNETLAL